MMTARFVSGASLFALLIVDICCHPVKTGYYPDPSYSSSYTNTAPNYDSHHRVPSGQFPPGAVRPNNAPSNGVSTPSYQAVPQWYPSVPQPTVQRGPAPSVGSSGPVFSGNRGTAVRPNPASSAQPGGAFQSGPQGWSVAPPTHFSGGEEMSTGTRGVVPGQPEDVSPAGSMYQAGELSNYAKKFEHGNSERETEEQGWLPPPPPLPVSVEKYARQGFTIQPQPNFNSESWGPYPRHAFMFVTGQHPPGTVTHTTSSYEQGRDHWQDVHYVRDAPYYPAPAQQIETFTGDFTDPESLEDPVAGSGQGDAQAGSGKGGAQAGSGQGGAQAGSGQGGAQAGYGQGGAHAGYGLGYGAFWQPVNHQAGGYNLGKVAY
ncbi:uncharacterized protein LOC141775426 isoform X2 [Sebastes fasciatus]|uniref:uncharacterized protein LOC141775426 isoform X2 n=1 Tax=Sebastes fasciatus TaxID=394691 RepID=UPI003D9E6C57